MKKIIIAVFATIMLANILTGCVSNVSDATNQVSAESESVSAESQKETETETAKEAALPGSLALAGVDNARQVSGFITEDGKAVKENMILRTGRLEEATETDIAALINQYNLTDIIDFRSEADAEKNPDPDLEGVNYHLMPLYGPSVNDYMSLIEVPEDVLKEYESAISGESDNPWHQDNGYVKYLSMGGSPELYDSNMSIVMRLIASDVHSQKTFRQMFDVLLAAEGSTDIHCSAGKDRTGAAIALILETIGVSRAEIIEEFLLTNEYVAAAIEADKQAAIAAGLPDDYVEAQEVMSGVTLVCINAFFDEIDTNYGGVQEYVKNQIGLTDEDIKTLKNKFTE